MLTPSARANRKTILFAAAVLIASMGFSFAQGGGASGGGTGGAGAGGGGPGAGAAGSGGAAGSSGAAVSLSPPPRTSTSPSAANPSNPNTMPQQSYAPLTPSRDTTASTPSTPAGGRVTSSRTEEQPSRSAQSGRTSLPKARSGHHKAHFAKRTWPYYCGSSPCVRIKVATLYAYVTPAAGVMRLRPVYTASTLWWPGFYDYAPGQFGRGHPRYGGYPRRAGQAD
jgi:hypothetical protein